MKYASDRSMDRLLRLWRVGRHDDRHAFDRASPVGGLAGVFLGAVPGFSGALLLAVFALIMAWESIARLIEPIAIQFDQAIGVAVLGLLGDRVNRGRIAGLSGTGYHEGGGRYARTPV